MFSYQGANHEMIQQPLSFILWVQSNKNLVQIIANCDTTNVIKLKFGVSWNQHGDPTLKPNAYNIMYISCIFLLKIIPAAYLMTHF